MLTVTVHGPKSASVAAAAAGQAAFIFLSHEQSACVKCERRCAVRIHAAAAAAAAGT